MLVFHRGVIRLLIRLRDAVKRKLVFEVPELGDVVDESAVGLMDGDGVSCQVLAFKQSAPVGIMREQRLITLGRTPRPP